MNMCVRATVVPGFSASGFGYCTSSESLLMIEVLPKLDSLYTSILASLTVRLHFVGCFADAGADTGGGFNILYSFSLSSST